VCSHFASPTLRMSFRFRLLFLCNFFPFFLLLGKFLVRAESQNRLWCCLSFGYNKCSICVNFCRYDTPFAFVSSGKRRPRTTQSMPSARHFRRQDMKRVASAPIVVNSYRNQVKAGIVRAMLPRTESSNFRSAFGAAEMWRSKLLTSRPTLERRLSSKHS